MPPRTLASLAHALGAAADLPAALVALGEGLAEIDRSAHLALLRYDGRRQMLVDRLSPAGSQPRRPPVGTAFDHPPGTSRAGAAAGAQFGDLGDQSADYARLFGLPSLPEGGVLAVRGLKFDGHLAAVLTLLEPKKIFGARTSERFAPSVALFDLAFAR